MTSHAEDYLDQALRSASPEAQHDALATITRAVWGLVDAHLPPQRYVLGSAAEADPLDLRRPAHQPLMAHGPNVCGWDLDQLADLTREAEATAGEGRIGAALRAWFTDHDLDPDEMGGAAAGEEAW